MGDEMRELPSKNVLGEDRIRAYVVEKALSNSTMLIAMLGGIGLLFANVAWLWTTLGLSSFVTWPALAGYGLLCIGSAKLGYDLFGAGRSKYASIYIERAKKWLQDEDLRIAQELRKKFESIDGGEQGLSQLSELTMSFDDLSDMLSKRFSSAGITYGRALGDSEIVRRVALDKLELITDQYKAIESIPEDLEAELKGLDPDSKMYEMMNERIGHRKEGLEAIKRLHEEVERALTKISHLTLQISHVGMRNDEFGSYLNELEALASKITTFDREV